METARGWRKSSYSGSNGDCVEVGEDWRTSRYSNPNGECIEVASGVKVRDTKDRAGPVLTFSPEAWTEFIDTLVHVQ